MYEHIKIDVWGSPISRVRKLILRQLQAKQLNPIMKLSQIFGVQYPRFLILDDNETKIEMIMKDRSPHVRHMSRPHPVNFKSVFEKIHWIWIFLRSTSISIERSHTFSHWMIHSRMRKGMRLISLLRHTFTSVRKHFERKIHLHVPAGMSSESFHCSPFSVASVFFSSAHKMTKRSRFSCRRSPARHQNQLSRKKKVMWNEKSRHWSWKIRRDIGRSFAFLSSIGNPEITESGASSSNEYQWMSRKKAAVCIVCLRVPSARPNHTWKHMHQRTQRQAPESRRTLHPDASGSTVSSPHIRAGHQKPRSERTAITPKPLSVPERAQLVRVHEALNTHAPLAFDPRRVSSSSHVCHAGEEPSSQPLRRSHVGSQDVVTPPPPPWPDQLTTIRCLRSCQHRPDLNSKRPSCLVTVGTALGSLHRNTLGSVTPLQERAWPIPQTTVLFRSWPVQHETARSTSHSPGWMRTNLDDRDAAIVWLTAPSHLVPLNRAPTRNGNTIFAQSRLSVTPHTPREPYRNGRTCLTETWMQSNLRTGQQHAEPSFPLTPWPDYIETIMCLGSCLSQDRHVLRRLSCLVTLRKGTRLANSTHPSIIRSRAPTTCPDHIGTHMTTDPARSGLTSPWDGRLAWWAPHSHLCTCPDQIRTARCPSKRATRDDNEIAIIKNITPNRGLLQS